MNAKDISEFILPIGAIFLGYKVLEKFGLIGSGSLDDPITNPLAPTNPLTNIINSSPISPDNIINTATGAYNTAFTISDKIKAAMDEWAINNGLVNTIDVSQTMLAPPAPAAPINDVIGGSRYLTGDTSIPYGF